VVPQRRTHLGESGGKKKKRRHLLEMDVGGDEIRMSYKDEKSRSRQANVLGSHDRGVSRRDSMP